MRWLKRHLLVLLTISSFSDRACAIQSGLPAMPDETLNVIDSARQTTFAFAECLVARHKKVVKALLDRPFTGYTDYRAFNNIADDDCLLNSNLRFGVTVMRGVLYQAFYQSQFRNSAPTVAKNPIDYPVEGTPFAHQIGPYLRYADCVVGARPDNVRALVMSKPVTTDETQAFIRLQDALGSCIVSGQLHFSRSALAGFLAEALYRRSISSFDVHGP